MRVFLRRPSAGDRAEFLGRVAASRALHRPWVSPPSTPAKFAAWLKRGRQATHASFLVCDAESGAIAGVVNINEIVRGAFRSGYLGYYVFRPFERRGLMKEGLRRVLRRAFGAMELHRLEANIQPGNTASKRLVRSLGFRREGFSPRYLRIGGRWRDHERWAIVRG